MHTPEDLGSQSQDPLRCRLSASRAGARGAANTAHSSVSYSSGAQEPQAHPLARSTRPSLGCSLNAGLACAVGRDFGQHMVTQTRGPGGVPRLGRPYRGVRARGAEQRPGSPVPGMWEGPEEKAARRGRFLCPREGSRRGARGARRCPLPTARPAGRGRGLQRRTARGRGARPPPGRPGGRKR